MSRKNFDLDRYLDMQDSSNWLDDLDFVEPEMPTKAKAADERARKEKATTKKIRASKGPARIKK